MSSNVLLVEAVTTLSAALLMIFAGTHKKLLDWGPVRTCTGCGRRVDRCRCGR